MNQHTSARLAMVLSVCLVSVALAGCVTERPEPMVVFDEVRYWFEDDLVVLNITIRNIGDFTPGPPGAANPTIWTTIRGWTPLDEAEREEVGDVQDVRSRWFQSVNLFFREDRGEPVRERYYSRQASETYGFPRMGGIPGPVTFEPNQTRSFELVYLPEEWYNDPEEYYQFHMTIRVTHPETKQQVGHTIQSGCFNHDLQEFFGPRDDGPNCYFYNKEGRPTRHGVALGVPLGEPAMIYGPRSDTPREQ